MTMPVAMQYSRSTGNKEKEKKLFGEKSALLRLASFYYADAAHIYEGVGLKNIRQVNDLCAKCKKGR